MNFKFGLHLGSIFSAILASSCCWLPFLLLIFGISTSTVGTLISKYKVPLNIIAIILLAFSFYSYCQNKRKQKRCCSEESKNSTFLQRLNLISLWVTTFIVVGLLCLPLYMKYLPQNNKKSTCDNDILNKIENIEQKASEKPSCCPN